MYSRSTIRVLTPNFKAGSISQETNLKKYNFSCFCYAILVIKSVSLTGINHNKQFLVAIYRKRVCNERLFHKLGQFWRNTTNKTDWFFTCLIQYPMPLCKGRPSSFPELIRNISKPSCRKKRVRGKMRGFHLR